MKRPSSLLTVGETSRTVAIIALCMVGLTTPAFAVTAAKTSQESVFCSTSLAADISKVNTSITNLENKFDTARDQRTSQLTANYAKWTQELQADRANWAQLRQQDFTKLMAKATTSAEKTAVTTYETAITNAINTRESANDAAINTYRSGVEGLISSQTATINEQVNAFSGAVTAAEDAAQASCQENPSQGPSIRLTFQTSLKTARETYAGERTSDATLTSQIQQLAQTRDTTIKANDATFLTAAKNAEATLKAAFKGTSTNV